MVPLYSTGYSAMMRPRLGQLYCKCYRKLKGSRNGVIQEVSGSFMIGDGAKVVKDTFKHRAVKGERSDMSNMQGQTLGIK
jgi:hypothetical protein